MRKKLALLAALTVLAGGCGDYGNDDGDYEPASRTPTTQEDDNGGSGGGGYDYP